MATRNVSTSDYSLLSPNGGQKNLLTIHRTTIVTELPRPSRLLPHMGSVIPIGDDKDIIYLLLIKAVPGLSFCLTPSYPLTDFWNMSTRLIFAAVNSFSTPVDKVFVKDRSHARDMSRGNT